MSPDFPTSQPDQRLGLHGLPRAIRTREVLPEKFLRCVTSFTRSSFFGAQRTNWISKERAGLVIASRASADSAPAPPHRQHWVSTWGTNEAPSGGRRTGVQLELEPARSTVHQRHARGAIRRIRGSRDHGRIRQKELHQHELQLPPRKRARSDRRAGCAEVEDDRPPHVTFFSRPRAKISSRRDSDRCAWLRRAFRPRAGSGRSPSCRHRAARNPR
jgi:hypothetical protein